MDKKTIGSFIAALRKSNGMTQQDVADRLNVSNKTVSKWERDESYPEITLIPIIAEIFNVTSDEILRGERILINDTIAENTDTKVDKQIRRIIGCSIARFKTISFIALALVFIGLICLFTISYAFNRPVIAFGVFLLFTVASILLELIQINLSNTTIKNNEILEDSDEILKPLYISKYKYAFIVFISNIAAVIFSLPFILVRDTYFVNSVISIETYLSQIPILIIITGIIFKLSYHISKRKLFIPEADISVRLFPSKKIKNLNVFHASLITIAYVITIIAINNEGVWKAGLISNLFVGALFSSVGIFIISILVFAVTSKELKDKLIIILAGVRNLIYSFAGLYFVYGIFFWMSNKSKSGFIQFPTFFNDILFFGIGTTVIYEITSHYLFKNKK